MFAEACDEDIILNSNHNHTDAGGWATECEMTFCAWSKWNHVYWFVAANFLTLPGLMLLAQGYFTLQWRQKNQVNVHYLRVIGLVGSAQTTWSGFRTSVWCVLESGMRHVARDLGMREALCHWTVFSILFLLLILRWSPSKACLKLVTFLPQPPK